MAGASDKLVWIDLEMTGLEPQECFILEIASLVTDADLEIVAEGPPREIAKAKRSYTGQVLKEAGVG